MRLLSSGMRHRAPHIPQGDATMLRALWRAETLDSVWRTPGDWDHPAVDALSEAIAAGRSPDAAAERLGMARAEIGVGIEETLDDAAWAFRAGGRDMPASALRAVSVGWALGQETRPALVSCVDPVSSLPTAQYLTVRLRELYARAAQQGCSVPGTHALLIADIAVEGLNIAQRFSRDATAGAELVCVLGEGHPMAALRPGLFAVVVERDEQLGTTIDRVRRALSHPGSAEAVDALAVGRRPPRVWLEALPGSAATCARLVTELAA
ncbi:MAG: hypothetical protein ACTMIR_10905 [Cellulomonadaceae bacterium]